MWASLTVFFCISVAYIGLQKETYFIMIRKQPYIQHIHVVHRLT